MPFQVSPGVNVSEIDTTTGVPAVSTTEGALAGVFLWGPVEERVLISSESELVARFGRPSSDNFETWFTGASFLAYSNKLYVARAASNTSFNAVANTAAVANTLVKNADHYSTLTLPAGSLYYARCPGDLGNSLKVSVCDSSAAYQSSLATDNANNTVAFEIAVGASTGTIRVTNSQTNTAQANTTANNILASITVGDYIEVGNTSIGKQVLKVTSKSTASSPNTGIATASLTFDSAYQLGVDGSFATATRYWEFYNNVDRAPGTSASAVKAGGTGDELHVVVVDEDGKFTGARGTILEVFQGVSRGTDAKSVDGAGNYYKDVINQRSSFIWFANHRTGAVANTVGSVVASTNLQPLSISFTGGTDGGTETTMALGDLFAAYDQFRAASDVDVSLILTGKSRGGVNGEALGNYLIDNIAEYRKDCVAFVSPERGDVVQVADPLEFVLAFRNSLRASSYGFLDSGYKYMYDRYNDVYRYVPLNGDIAGLAVRTDEVRDPWFSPAGYQRGNLRNVVKLAYNPDKADRDQLYKRDINPVITESGQGTLLFGDKTLLGRDSAFSRINVRRLFIVLEKAIATASKYSLFELNDAFTRAQFRNMVEPFLRSVQGRRGLEDFRVVCDETNNTADVRNRQEFVGDIYIKPPRSINFIQLNFVAVRSGVDFNEIVGQF